MADIITNNRSFSISELSRAEDVYRYLDYGTNYFGHQFKLEFELSITSSANEQYCCVWAVSNVTKNIKTQEDDGDNCIFLLCKDNGSDTTLYLRADDYSSVDNEITLSKNTTYYLRVRRSRYTVTCSVYSDEERSVLVDFVEITLNNLKKYRYLYGMSSYLA